MTTFLSFLVSAAIQFALVYAGCRLALLHHDKRRDQERGQ